MLLLLKLTFKTNEVNFYVIHLIREKNSKKLFLHFLNVVNRKTQVIEKYISKRSIISSLLKHGFNYGINEKKKNKNDFTKIV